MTPPQKQPAVTREEFEALQKRDDEIPGGDHCYCCEFMALVDRLLTERDEANREVEFLKASRLCGNNGSSICTDCANALAEEKRKLDEAIREVEMLKSQRAYSTKEWNDKQDEVGRLYIESLKVKSLEEDLMAEKRRTAAYREVAIREVEAAKLHFEKHHSLPPFVAADVDAEAQKLLADSGGEKCNHRWSRRRDGKTCHVCGEIRYGEFVEDGEKS